MLNSLTLAEVANAQCSESELQFYKLCVHEAYFSVAD